MNYNRLILPSLFFTATAWLFGWLWAFFAFNICGPVDNGTGYADEPRLPFWLSFFQTPDNSLLGDGAWKRCEAAHWAWRTRFSWFPLLYRYLGRVGWIMRNPGQGFDAHIAAHIDPACKFTFYGNLSARDKPVYSPGSLYVTARNPDGSEYWAEYNVSKSFAGFCWMTKYGWELRAYVENLDLAKTQSTASFILSARPSGITI